MSIIGVIIIGLCCAGGGFIVGMLAGISTERQHIDEQISVQGYKLKYDRYTNRITIERIGNYHKGSM